MLYPIALACLAPALFLPDSSAYDWSGSVPGFECVHSKEQGQGACAIMPEESLLPGVWNQTADAKGPAASIQLLAASSELQDRYDVCTCACIDGREYQVSMTKPAPRIALVHLELQLLSDLFCGAQWRRLLSEEALLCQERRSRRRHASHVYHGRVHEREYATSRKAGRHGILRCPKHHDCRQRDQDDDRVEQ